ncbi:hypothetical protein F3Y22_tig00111330pilonHSYRG00903 [Hibiscus syriacus]|uniref:Pentatricopeptide repeat-containing protein n=1 Tax=Hibiscus syriacus TaxID=106335 RepID=A0A6A2YQ43_HIBSY|nr:hypothetical protein F3Y22_tig00111330pilonHSYRG00903 [Hibiscus syriacus]
MIDAKLVPDVYTYTNVINAHCRIGSIDKAKGVLMEMKECSPGLVTYNVMISGLCRAGSVDEALKENRLPEAKLMMEEMRRAGLNPTHIAYTALINGFIKQAGDLEKSKALINEMKSRFEEARRILDRMMENGVMPDIFCCSTLINGLCKAQRINEARRILDEMVDMGLNPDEHTYGTFIHVYAKAGEMEAVERCFREMQSYGIAPNNAICILALINSLCKVGNVTEALLTYRCMSEKGVLPDIKTYIALIHGLATNGSINDALHLFSQLDEKGIVPDVYTYTSLISVLSKLGDKEAALNLYNKMCQKGIAPNIVTYNTMIDGLCNEDDTRALGDTKKAWEMFNEISQKGLAPNTKSYSMIIDGYCKSGYLTQAFLLLDEMHTKGVPSDTFTCSALINGCCNEGEMDKAVYIFSEMLHKGFASIFSFNVLIDGLCKLGKPNEAKRLLDAMVDKSIAPNHIREASRDAFSFRVNGYNGVEPDEIIYGLVAEAYVKENYLIRMLKLLDEILVKNVAFNKNPSFLLLDALCKTKNFLQVPKLFEEMAEQGLKLSPITCHNLICGFHNRRSPDTAERIVECLIRFGWVPNSTTLNSTIDKEYGVDSPKQATFGVPCQVFKFMFVEGGGMAGWPCVIFLAWVDEAGL